MTDRDTGGKAVLDHGEVVIRLSTAALREATERSNIFFACKELGDQLKVSSEAELTESFILRLNEEGEDGSTLISRMFDKAIEKLVEQGDEGVVSVPKSEGISKAMYEGFGFGSNIKHSDGS